MDRFFILDTQPMNGNIKTNLLRGASIVKSSIKFDEIVLEKSNKIISHRVGFCESNGRLLRFAYIELVGSNFIAAL